MPEPRFAAADEPGRVLGGGMIGTVAPAVP